MIKVRTTYFGVFQSSIEQKTSKYNALYLAGLFDYYDSFWFMGVKLSERGSHGYIHQLSDSLTFLVLYEL